MSELKTAKDLQEDYDSAISEIANDTRENAWKDAMRVVLNYVTRIDAAETALALAEKQVSVLSASLDSTDAARQKFLDRAEKAETALAAANATVEVASRKATKEICEAYIVTTPRGRNYANRKEVTIKVIIEQAWIAARKAAQNDTMKEPGVDAPAKPHC